MSFFLMHRDSDGNVVEMREIPSDRVTIEHEDGRTRYVIDEEDAER